MRWRLIKWAAVFIMMCALFILTFWYYQDIVMTNTENGAIIKASSDIAMTVTLTTEITTSPNIAMPVIQTTEMTASFDIGSTADTRMTALKQVPPIHVLINARMRTGSSLTGRYFSKRPDTMFLYEPELTLRYNMSLRYDLFNDSAAQIEDIQTPFYELIGGFFDCEYTRRPELFHFMEGNDWAKSKNGLAHLQGADYNAKQISKKCKTKTHRVVKTVRINDISKGLEILKQYNVKVIQVVRDPRGMINSRIKFENLDSQEKKGLSMKKISEASKNYCIWLNTNINAVLVGPEWLKKNYMIVRYEDLSTKPRQIVPKMYEFVGLPSNDTIIKSERLGTGHTDAWRYSLPFNQTHIAQNNCPDDIFEKLGYVKVQNEIQQRNDSLSLVTSPHISKLISLA
ncbi:carbohydrate sulfotransferase 1-like [Saccoglossus kowalevskii]